MKKFSIVCLSAMLVISACHNEGSSTVGIYESSEDSNLSEKKEEAAKEEQLKEQPVKMDTTNTAAKDTSKTTLR